MKELVEKRYEYAGEMRPRGIKIFSGYWPAYKILDRLPDSDNDVCLILTSMELKGEQGRIHGTGHDKKAIASSDGFTEGVYNDIFRPDGVSFNAMVFGEIGHALGLEHHTFYESNPCEISHNQHPGPDWQSLDQVRFCNDCYKKIT